MSGQKTWEFLDRHGINSENLIISFWADDMCEHMRDALCGDVRSMPMIPTYISNDGAVPRDVPVVVIDAGGTNFRSALVKFTDGGYQVMEMKKALMPGVEESCTWEEFISFTADQIESFMPFADRIGFCFSYEAEITPDMDGLVSNIDKEVEITGGEGKPVGASLIAELERRGITGKRVVVTNDTAAVLMGGSAMLDKSRYSAFIGQVSGTGTNTCISLPCRMIKKLGVDSERGMIVNVESGAYDGMRGGDLDAVIDGQSLMPGAKLFEKLTAGAYLGGICLLLLNDAADIGAVSPETAEKIRALRDIDGSNVDAWANGNDLDSVSANHEDEEFVIAVCRELLIRSARCMCVNLMALGRLCGQGTDKERPICVCAEGSLVQKSRIYRFELHRLLKEYCADTHGLYFELHADRDTTIPGTAAAALLN